MNKELRLHTGLMLAWGVPSDNRTSDHLCGWEGPRFSKFHLQNIHKFSLCYQYSKNNETSWGRWVSFFWNVILQFNLIHILEGEYVLGFTITVFRQRNTVGIVYKKILTSRKLAELLCYILVHKQGLVRAPHGAATSWTKKRNTSTWWEGHYCAWDGGCLGAFKCFVYIENFSNSQKKI